MEKVFKLLGVKEGFPILSYPNRTTVTKLKAAKFLPEYFELDDKKFQPFLNRFTASEYAELLSIFLLPHTVDNPVLAKLFWADVIDFLSVQALSVPVTAFWGNQGLAGWTTGDHVSNYLQWFIKAKTCIPAVTRECLKSTSILLNSSEIKSIAGKYLPVFDGPELSSDWKSFFSFRTSLELADYLNLLSNVSFDIDEGEGFKIITTKGFNPFTWHY